ncbi:MAG: YceI family protein [Kofleriaceae bacterium]
MPRYRIDAGKLTVRARSRLHDTTTVWSKVTGQAEADPQTLSTEGAKANFTVDMTAFDAGDWLKNRKLKSDFAMDSHPRATFELRSVSDVVRDPASGGFTANAEGVLRWRGKEVVLELAGRGTLDAMRLEASATFELDIRHLGLQAPRFLMIKMDDEVTVEVTVRGTVVP